MRSPVQPASAVLLLAGLLVPALAGGCGTDDTQPGAARAEGQRRERVELTHTYPPDSPAEDIQHSRASLTRIVSQAEECVTAPFPGKIELELPPAPADSFAGALCLTGFPAGKTPPRARLYFEIDFVGARETRKHSVTLSLSEALADWAPMQFVRGGTDATKLTIRGRFLGEDTPQDLSSLRFALAVPTNDLLGRREDSAPNVLVISIDTLRADHLSCYGYARPTSPTMDALAAGGVVFERAFSSAPWTLPSYGSLFTALLPADHRAGIVTQRERAFGTDETPPKGTTETLRADVPTLAELLSRRGYQTAGFVANPFLATASGLSRGFQSYTSYQYNARTGVDLAQGWIGSRPAARWFVFLHLIDPHIPYAPPKPFDTRFSKRGVDELESWPPDLDGMRKHPPSDEVKQACVDLYDGEIAFVDAEIGRLIETLRSSGELDRTLIVLHSDHGEEFWDHGSCDHGHTQFDELLHVPLVLAWPQKLPAQRVKTRVRTLDLLPTIADLVGFDAPRGLEGRSLVPVIDGRETTDRDGISEALMHATRETKAIWEGAHKLIATGTATNLLFDTSADPKELDDHSAADPGRVQALRQKLLERHARTQAAVPQAQPFRPDPGRAHELNKLGYGGNADAGEEPKRSTTPEKKPQ